MIYNSPFATQTSFGRIKNESLSPAVRQSTYYAYNNNGNQSYQYKINQNNVNRSLKSDVPIIRDFKYEYPSTNIYNRTYNGNNYQSTPIITKSTFSADYNLSYHYYNRGELIDQYDRNEQKSNIDYIKSGDITPPSIIYPAQYTSYTPPPPPIQQSLPQQPPSYYKQQPTQHHQHSYYQPNSQQQPPPSQPPQLQSQPLQQPQQQQQQQQSYYQPKQVVYKINYKQPEYIIQPPLQQEQIQVKQQPPPQQIVIIKNDKYESMQPKDDNKTTINNSIKEEKESKKQTTNIIDEKRIQELKMKALAEIRPIKRNKENETIKIESKKKCIDTNRINENENENEKNSKKSEEEDEEENEEENEEEEDYGDEDEDDINQFNNNNNNNILQIHLSTSKFQELSQKYNNKPEYDLIGKTIYDENIQDIIQAESRRHIYLPNTDSNTPSLRSLIYELKKKLIERKGKIKVYEKKYKTVKKKIDVNKYELNELDKIIKEKESKIVEFKSDIEEIEKMCKKLTT